MPHRSELKSIVSGALGSFVSRNNDYDGYWSIGLLYRDALLKPTKEVNVNLVGTSEKACEPFKRAIEEKYREMLFGLMFKRSLPQHWIKSAELSVLFEYSGKPASAKTTAEKPYVARFSAKTDIGKLIQVELVGSCWPHDPAREIRSNRAEEGMSAHHQTANPSFNGTPNGAR